MYRLQFAVWLITCLLCASMLRAAPGEEAGAEQENRPPRIEVRAVNAMKQNDDQRTIALRAGVPVTIYVQAGDPEGDAVRVWAGAMPPGAVFDTARATVFWTPSVSTRGSYRLQLFVSDGVTTVERAWSVEVLENAPPRKRCYSGINFPRVGEKGTFVWVEDDGPGSVSIFDVVKPRGVELIVTDTEVHYKWSPTNEDLGWHRIFFRVRDGVHVVEAECYFRVYPEIEGSRTRRIFEPFAGPSVWRSFVASERWFRGFEAGLSLFSTRDGWSAPYDCRRYGFACNQPQRTFRLIFQGLKNGTELEAVRYGVSFQQSFETHINRKLLIPFYGLEAGGGYRASRGHAVQLSPSLSVALFQAPGAVLELSSSVHLAAPLRSRLSGVSASVRLIVDLGGRPFLGP